jgi:hypothetical protein
VALVYAFAIDRALNLEQPIDAPEGLQRQGRDRKRSIKPICFVLASSANVRAWSGAN